jgi:hypothetical protein
MCVAYVIVIERRLNESAAIAEKLFFFPGFPVKRE